MSRQEIQRKFDEIVAFSGVEDFLDTPVKHYSSGMRVRLAFSVAAHLEPEILFVDEVLAVGDAAFQKKCLGRMNDVAKEGRTVLFVSHQMESVIGLCQRVVWLEQGRVRADLPAEEGVHKYLQHQSYLGAAAFDERTDRVVEGSLTLSRISLRNKEGMEIGAAIAGEPLTIAFHCICDSNETLKNVEIKAYINDDLGRRLFCAGSSLKGMAFEVSGRETVLCLLPKLPLPPGRYGLSYVVHVNGFRSDKLYDAMYFDVEPGDYFGFGQRISGIGAFYCDQEWAVEN
jgi:lipopolysaccharide transport system ATP-binding protein